MPDYIVCSVCLPVMCSNSECSFSIFSYRFASVFDQVTKVSAEPYCIGPMYEAAFDSKPRQVKQSSG